MMPNDTTPEDRAPLKIERTGYFGEGLPLSDSATAQDIWHWFVLSLTVVAVLVVLWRVARVHWPF